MFQFRRFPTYAYLIQRTLTEYCSAGFPHSEICGSKLMCSSPQLIAACHVLLRLLMPRHSPCALYSLTLVEQSHFWAVLYSIMNYAGLTEVLQLATLFYPFTRTAFAILSLSSTTLLLLPSVACSSYFQSALFSFQGADFQSLSRPDWNTWFSDTSIQYWI